MVLEVLLDMVSSLRLGCREPVCRVISHSQVRTHVNEKPKERDWLAMLIVVSEIAILFTGASLVWAACHFS